MYQYKVKYANFKEHGQEFWTVVTISENHNDEEALINALQKVISREERTLPKEIVVLQVAPMQ